MTKCTCDKPKKCDRCWPASRISRCDRSLIYNQPEVQKSPNAQLVEQETLVGAVNGVSVVMESLDRNAEIAAAAADAQSIKTQPLHHLL